MATKKEKEISVGQRTINLSPKKYSELVRRVDNSSKVSPRQEVYQRLMRTRAKEPDASLRTKKIAEKLGFEESGRKLRKSQLKQIFESSQEREANKFAISAAKSPLKRVFGNSRRSVGERNFSSKVRKLINVISPKDLLAQTLTYGGGVSKGRGRPLKSYKPRYVPEVGFVRVPTAVYNQMISEAKTKQRLAFAQQQSQRQAYAEQVAMSQDPRYQPDFAEDQFLEGQGFDQQSLQNQQAYPQEEMQFQQQELSSQMPIQQQLRPNLIQQLAARFSGARRAPIQGNPFFDVNGQPIGSSPRQFGQQYGQQFGYPQQFQGQAIKSEPQVTAISSKANLLNVPNQFDRPGSGKILFKNPFYQDY